MITMKKIICVVLVMALCATLFVACGNRTEESTYTLKDCRVYDVGRYEGEIAIIDETQNIWTWRQPVGDVAINDKCDLVMSDNGTPNNIYDDVIISINWK